MNKTIGFVDCAFRSPASEGASGGGAHSHGERREVVVNGTRVKTVDIHAHCVVPEALAILDEKAGNQKTWIS